MAHQPVIDMRSRPALLHDFYGRTPGNADEAVVRWLNGRVGSRDVAHFEASRTLDGYLAQIQAARIDTAVVVGRDTPGIRHDNDEIHALVHGQPALVGLGSVDPHRLGVRGAVNEVERAVRLLGLKGINVEPGFGAPPRPADDPLLFPVYDACQQLGVPVTLMGGPTAPDLALVQPSAVARVARAFPRLAIVCYHGFYPYVNEIIGVALRWENVHIVPDMYIFSPGGRLYVEAANGAMRAQILFGSSYPFRAMGQSIDDYLALGFSDDAIGAVMHDNARRVLGL